MLTGRLVLLQTVIGTELKMPCRESGVGFRVAVSCRAPLTAYMPLKLHYAEALMPSFPVAEHGIAFFTGLPQTQAEPKSLLFIALSLDTLVATVELVPVAFMAIVITATVK